jgi:ferrous iron transport protein A
MTAMEPENQLTAFPLNLAQSGEKLRITAFRTSKGLGKRLGGLGLRVGSVVQIVQRQRNGSVVVARENNRIALGSGATQQIGVTLCDEDTALKVGA